MRTQPGTLNAPRTWSRARASLRLRRSHTCMLWSLKYSELSIRARFFNGMDGHIRERGVCSTSYRVQHTSIQICKTVKAFIFFTLNFRSEPFVDLAAVLRAGVGSRKYK